MICAESSNPGLGRSAINGSAPVGFIRGFVCPITSYLGAELARAVDRPIPDEAEHMALARLPWFRVGWMPDELRLRLLRDLDPQFRTVVRDAIERLIYNAAERSDRPALAEPVEISRPPTDWSRGSATGRERRRARQQARIRSLFATCLVLFPGPHILS